MAPTIGPNKINLAHIIFITITLFGVILHSYTYLLSSMINKKVSSPEGTSRSGGGDTLTEMLAAINRLSRHNQTL